MRARVMISLSFQTTYNRTTRNSALKIVLPFNAQYASKESSQYTKDLLA